jgi:hypothetical protein
MVLFRALGWLLLALAVGAVVYDGLNWWSDGALRLLALGELWSRVDLASLNAFQAGRPGRAVAATGAADPQRARPAAFVIAGVIFLWLGRRVGSRTDPSFLGMSQRPRRRRSRGLS